LGSVTLLGVKTGGVTGPAFCGRRNDLEVIMQIQIAVAPAVPAAVIDSALYFHQIWPPIVIASGLWLSVAWASLLGYGLVELVGLAF
jgi:hypothetical protein